MVVNEKVTISLTKSKSKSQIPLRDSWFEPASVMEFRFDKKVTTKKKTKKHKKGKSHLLAFYLHVTVSCKH